MDYYEIGQQIRKSRKAHGLSQEQLAEMVGISVTHMSHIETGNTKLSLPVLVEIATALNVRTDDLLGRSSYTVGDAAGEFAAIGQHIVAAGLFRLNVCHGARFLNDGKLPVHIVIIGADEEGEIQIAQVMEHSAAAGQPPGELSAFFLQKGGAAFSPGILIAPDDHGVLILPKI